MRLRDGLLILGLTAGLAVSVQPALPVEKVATPLERRQRELLFTAQCPANVILHEESTQILVTAGDIEGIISSGVLALTPVKGFLATNFLIMAAGDEEFKENTEITFSYAPSVSWPNPGNSTVVVFDRKASGSSDQIAVLNPLRDGNLLCSDTRQF